MPGGCEGSLSQRYGQGEMARLWVARGSAGISGSIRGGGRGVGDSLSRMGRRLSS